MQVKIVHEYYVDVTNENHARLISEEIAKLVHSQRHENLVSMDTYWVADRYKSITISPDSLRAIALGWDWPECWNEVREACRRIVDEGKSGANTD